MGIASSQHSCGPAKFELEPGSVLAARYFKSKSSGLLLHHASWRPSSAAESKGVVYLVHGYGEHIMRFMSFGEALARAGYVVHGLDLQGHGQSEGDRAFLTTLEDVVSDVLQLVNEVHPHPPGLPRFLFGHSMGGLIAIRTAQSAPEGTFSGLILSGPALAIDPSVDNALNRFLATQLSSILPKLPVQPLDERMLCSDEVVVKQYSRDPLCYHGSIRVRTGYEIIKGIDEASKAAPSMTAPLLIVHSEGDQLCRIDGSRKLFGLCTGITDKTLIEYPKSVGYLHEMLNEKEGSSKVAADVIGWVGGRLAGGGSAAAAK